MGQPRKGVGSVRVSLLSREAAGLFAVGLSVLAWYTESEPPQPEARRRLVRGEPDVQIMASALSADGMLATADAFGRVALRDAGSGWAFERPLPFPGHACALAFAPDGRSLACGGISSGITVYDLGSDGQARTIPVPVDQVKTIAFSPDGRTVAVAAERDASILLWDLATGRLRRTLRPPSPILRLAFSPDGRYLASGGLYHQPAVILWEVETGASRLRFQEPHFPIAAMAFSPDGTLLATASVCERRVRIWDLESAEPRRPIAGHALGTNSLAFSPDGMILATAGNDGMVRLWTVATGRQQAALDGGAMSVGHVAFAAAGRWLVATARDDDDIRLWELAELGLEANPDRQPASTASASIR